MCFAEMDSDSDSYKATTDSESSEIDEDEESTDQKKQHRSSKQSKKSKKAAGGKTMLLLRQSRLNATLFKDKPSHSLFLSF